MQNACPTGETMSRHANLALNLSGRIGQPPVGIIAIVVSVRPAMWNSGSGL